MRKPELDGSERDRPGISVSKPGALLIALVLSAAGTGYAIYWLIRSARG
ncbi:MAG TPA: hypothetical protein VFQ35_14190 [Polyangiaceae bacterium]|nr:hypothetical protein [Polyangiaceae bacterium]